MNLDLEKVAKLEPKLKRILSNEEADMNAFLESRTKLIDQYKNQLEWYAHVQIPLNGLDRIVEVLEVSPWDEIIVIAVKPEETNEHIFIYLSEDASAYLGMYVQVD